jgi:RNA polymerase sigma-70 factor, ECF subfamily
MRGEPDPAALDPGHDPGSLIARALGGEIAAFRLLYDMHVRRVHALSLRIMTDGAEAEELTQDVFVTAWRRLSSFRGDARFSTWLHGITLRMARQRLRGLLRRRRHEGRFMLEYLKVARACMPSANLDLERALATLPRRMRTALVLHAVEGYSQAETAQLMGIAEGSVKAHIHRARRLLKERMYTDGRAGQGAANGPP